MAARQEQSWIPRRLHNLKENLIALDHSNLAACPLFYCLETHFQIPHLGLERDVSFFETPINITLRMYLLIDLPHPEPAALSNPQRVLEQQNQRCKGDCK